MEKKKILSGFLIKMVVCVCGGGIGLIPLKIICWFIMIKREKWDVNRKKEQ